MHSGRIVKLATDRELYQNPEHPYTEALLSAVPVPDPDICKRRTLSIQQLRRSLTSVFKEHWRRSLCFGSFT